MDNPHLVFDPRSFVIITSECLNGLTLLANLMPSAFRRPNRQKGPVFCPGQCHKTGAKTNSPTESPIDTFRDWVPRFPPLGGRLYFGSLTVHQRSWLCTIRPGDVQFIHPATGGVLTVRIN